MLAGRVTHHLDRIDQRHGLVSKKGDQLADRGNAEHLDPCDELGFSRLPQGHDDPPEPGLLGCQSGRQNVADRPDRTIQPKLTQQHSAAQLLGTKAPLSRKDRSDDREVKVQRMTDLDVQTSA